MRRNSDKIGESEKAKDIITMVERGTGHLVPQKRDLKMMAYGIAHLVKRRNLDNEENGSSQWKTWYGVYDL
jgi:hypothetical protein